ncbi:MAG: hypothetical protein DWQ05_13650 [Calditrichaeota bacterium]|nr:MAG: hypothetical protein DWQ05_13650 [Calditrichota bacterium]
MQFVNSHLMIFSEDIEKIVDMFSLNTKDLLVESFSPGDNAIIVETQNKSRFRLHIDLQEKRIIAAKKLGENKSDTHDFDKYIAFMK